MDGVLCRGVFACLAVAGIAGAAPARVALVHEVEPDALEQRTLTRLRAELIAAGFTITEVERHGQDVREAAEAEPTAAGVFATIVIVPRTADIADIWVADRITGKTVVRRIQVPPGSGRDVAPILAVRAVELLQASLLEAIDPAPRAEPATADVPPSPVTVVPSDVSAWMQARGPRSDPRFALQAGAGVIHSFSGVGPAVLPLLGFAYRVTPDLAVGVRGATAFAPDLRALGGTIAVRQDLVSLEITYTLPLEGATVRPIAIGGLGVYHLDVVGVAAPPYKGESNDLFAAIFGLGPGASVRLGERVSLLADVRLLFIAPQPIVRAAGAEVGRMSRPTLCGELLVDVAF